MAARGDEAADIVPVGVGELGRRERLAAVGDDVGLGGRAQHGGFHARLIVGDARGPALLREAVGAEEGDVGVEALEAFGAPTADERVGAAADVPADEEHLALGVGEDARELERVRDDRESRAQQELLGDGVRRAARVEQHGGALVDEARGVGGDGRLFLGVDERALVERLLDEADLGDGAAEALLGEAFFLQVDDVLADGFG